MIYHILGYWNDFDGWCIQHGIDPLEIPSRRLLSAAWRWMTEDRGEEQIENIFKALDQRVAEVETAFRTSKIQAAPVVDEDGKSKVVPVSRWQAPPGWTPPGWSEESAYKNSMAGMMGVTSTGGGKIGGAVK